MEFFCVIILTAFLICFCLQCCCKKRQDESNASPDLNNHRQHMQETRRNNPPQSPAGQTNTSVGNSREEIVKNSLFTRDVGDSDASTRTIVGVIMHPEKFEDPKKKKDNDGNFMTRSWRTALNNVQAMGAKPTCAICLDHYEVGDTMAWGKHDECNHVFHEECIAEWLQNHDDCPLCRVNLLETEKHQNEPHSSIAAVAAARAAEREEAEGNQNDSDNSGDIEAAAGETTADETNTADDPSADNNDLQRFHSSRTSDGENDAENPSAENDGMQRFLSSRTSNTITDVEATAEVNDVVVAPSAPPMEVGE